MAKVAVFIADGSEEVEAITPVDLLRRAKVDVDVVSIMPSLEITASRDIKIKADKLLDEITFDEIYNRNLKVMDLTATTMCKENDLPIYVFNMDIPGNLKKVIAGEPIGTLVHK